MKRIFKTDHGGPLGESTCDLYRILDGFRARINEHGLLREIAWRERIQFLGNGDVTFIRRYAETNMEKLLELLSQRIDDARRSLTYIQATDTAGKINETISVHVFTYGAFLFRNEDRRRM